MPYANPNDPRALASRKAAAARYRQTDKGKKARAKAYDRWAQTDNGKSVRGASRSRYDETDKAKATRLSYVTKRYQEDLDFRLTTLLRARLRAALKSNSRTGSAVRDLGCTIPEFKAYIEALWQAGMTWDNLGQHWQLDHIKALGLFDLKDPEQLRQAVHYTNIQPLTTADHAVKSVADCALIRQRKLANGTD